MKIKTLDIKQFGRFEQKKIMLPASPFVIVYGENEAGKSTMMHFILSQLFGFPQKKALEKWRDKHHSTLFGGSMTFAADDGNTYRLERILDEEARLSSETGTSTDLRTLLRGIDRMLYQNVFCFDLEGLQDIDKKNPSDMNDLLLGAGMIGSGTLGKLELALEKKCGQLFKKSGKKPQLNRLFSDLSSCSSELKTWEKKLDTFQVLKEKIKTNNEQLAGLELQKKELQQTFQMWTAFSAARPLLMTLRTLENERKRLGLLQPFPQNGKEMFEDSRKMLISLKKELRDLNEQIDHLDDSIQMIRIDAQWSEEEPALLRLFRSAANDEQNGKERRRLEDELREHRAAYRQLCDQLGEDWTSEKIRQASSEFTLDQQLKNKLNRWKKSLARKQEAARDLDSMNEKIAFLEKRLKDLSGDHGAIGSRVKERSGGSGSRVIVACIIALVLTITMTLMSALLITPLAGVPVFIIGLAMAGGIFFVTGSRKENRKGMEQFHHILDDRQSAEASLTVDQLRSAKTALDQKREDVRSCTISCEEEKRNIQLWLRERGYSIDDLDWAEETVRLVGQAQEKCRKIDTLNDQLRHLIKSHENFENECLELAKKLGMPGGDATYLEKQYHLVTERIRQRQELSKQRLIYVKQRERFSNRIEALIHEQKKLFNQAQVEDEQQFFKAAEYAVRVDELTKQIQACRIQLLELTGSEKRLQYYFSYLDENKWEGLTELDFKNHISELEADLKTIRDQVSKDQASCESMEENDSYREMLDRYHTLLTEANLTAKDWAVYETALWAIQKAKEQYREQRLPKVMKEALHYFQYVTDGRYETLQLGDDGFIAGRSDGRRFSAAELSRGTAEQLYLSLRLALMGVFSGDETLPLIIDDGFVNFDHERSEKVYRLLEKVSEKRQVILLTCHINAYMKEHPESILRLQDNMNESLGSTI
ncbi:ATP-binding protein [Sporolactobacillus laevolacticus]|uniref:YhaN AAA domain-containing protein n=1 Tax=Sporolactobacillus laevolacticus DSM 442 TaxID=1395513 RepID=V6IU28_9BACL|nr:AAA family ATPase [Sporolactobacillus laevolacticus]EST10513.1 hypothetical protein P343_16895 [Sporolactobacillus laevolacticus DSM 442]